MRYACKSMQEQLNKRHQRRAVSPIIATLLMIAVTVVGGILIFTFSQDFFTDTSVITPTFDNLEFFGYDARDQTDDLDSADGTGVTCGDNDQDNQLDDDECFLIYVRNIGDAPAIIDEIRVFGERYTLSVAAIGASEPDAEEFLILDETGADTDRGFINPNNEATIAITYEDDVSDEVKVGRTIPITIITGSGSTILFNIISGSQEGGTIATD